VLVACLVYCLVVPRQYEASARVALRVAPATGLNLEGTDGGYSGSFASGQTQLETLASVFRSDQLAWRVIVDKKLYGQRAFQHGIISRFPGFRPESPSPEARALLLERFQDSLRVRTIPRTLLLEVRFRSRDPMVSAAVVNALIHAYQDQETEARILATAQASGWLEQQLNLLKARSDLEEMHLAEFQKEHGLLITLETLSNGQPGATEHGPPLREVDELASELVTASSERILREAEYRAAAEGDPELILASDPRLQSETGGLSVTVFRELHERRSALEQEQAQLALDHGPNYPRMQEIHEQLQDLDRQLQAEDGKLRERFRVAWQTSVDREKLLRNSLEQRTGEGQKVNEAAAQYVLMRREADATHELYLRMQDKVASAGLAAGVHGSDLWIVDPAQPPVRPAVPNWPLTFAIAAFAGVWLAVGGAFMKENLRLSANRILSLVWAVLLGSLLGGFDARAQAPTPSTSGLPTGVARIPGSTVTRAVPNSKEAPPLWNAASLGTPIADARLAGAVPGPIVSGDLLDVSEFHTPEFHTTVRVSASGTVLLPMIGEVTVLGLDETQAAHAVAAALVAKGILLRPQISVLMMSFASQDVTVAGEVARPGVYPYGAHHRLLDLISAASGLGPAAGSVVSIAHRDDPEKPVLIPLDLAAGAGADRNPELKPGDTILVSRAGVVYVVGDVIRPGGFTMEPAQSMTVLQAVSLAWGPTQSAVLKKALLIHEQNGNRAVTTLNLKRMLRGLDPDRPIGEHDILFVPDSAMKNLWNRSLESVVQSAAGVSIYAGLVYSQRF
jgi:polysaccharide export outer membrane protein